ncbi:hypothetical protein BpHYR1_012803 [Brachionus plicatilis]|uniref:Uncharacterized protein n=1 Tax=Brachionus plicatilis TaxID=10195 RepID=A0A3M7RZ61_BRAPC|nr:hypothetical protein BpHYR1_012803 [Brachionus plicatilis]
MESSKKLNQSEIRKPKRIKKRRKPHAKTGLISTAAYLAEKYVNKTNEDFDETKSEQQHLDASCDFFNHKIDKADGAFDVGKSVSASANLAELKAGNEDIGLKTSVLSANAHAEYGFNNSVGVHASLVRAEGHFGPVTVGTGLNLDCSASVGVNGVEASLFGTGISLGPKIGIKTPFADLKVNLF